MIEIKRGESTIEYGPGIGIYIDGEDVARAIVAYLVAHGIHVSGPCSVKVGGQLCGFGEVYVDPSGFVIFKGQKISGRG